jgi:tRNA1Val (adenine37-N6)-methyltransferase
MSNSWFQFKQFRVDQDKCAMKVGTDGVLLGAWTPLNDVQSVVDLGSGTGLISLMIAQRSKARVTGIESDMDAAQQSAENFAKSPWPERLESVWADVHEMSELWDAQFDLAVCNPPFFDGHFRPSNAPRNNARQLVNAGQFEKKTWFDAAFKLTKPHGSAAFILPFDTADIWIKKAIEAGWFIENQVFVGGNLNKPFKRVLIFLKKMECVTSLTELFIEGSERGKYTFEFGELVKEFYLNAQIELP